MNEAGYLTNLKPITVGKCIYCGSISNLTDEHIIPHGLAGPWQLLKASCQDCCKITSGFEGDVLRHSFLLARTALKLPTYHRKNRPKEFQFSARTGDVDTIIKVPASECPTMFIMPLFEQPGYVTANPKRSNVQMTGTCIYSDGKRLKDLIEKRNLNSISYTVSMGATFARLLAKIAYGMVVRQKGLDAIERAYVIPCILGTKDDVGRWVGCEDGHRSPELLPKVKFLHTINLIENHKEIAAKIRLFASYQSPEYMVIVGKLK